MRVKQALWRQLAADGVEVVYGNPGTFEQGMLDALQSTPGIRYVMGLQEAAVLAMGTNHARVTRRAAVVQLHAAAGFGNAVGALQETLRGYVPMLILVGEHTQAAQAFDGYLVGDVVELARPVTKWCARVSSSGHFLRVLRRAWTLAHAPPRGPVLLAFPMDILDGVVAGSVAPTPLPTTRVAPDEKLLDEVASGLAAARRPMILIGDSLAYSRGESEAFELARLLGAPIHGANLTMAGKFLSHPAWAGYLPITSGELVARVTRESDAILCVGATLGSEIFPEPNGAYLKEGAALYQIDDNAPEVGKNIAPTIGIVADPKATLAALIERLEKPEARPREAPAPASAAAAPASAATGRLTARSMMGVLAECLPRDAFVTDESMTATDHLRAALRGRADVDYLACISRGLGSGWPAGIAAKLAHPKRPVVAVSADGAAMYVIAALWTAAHLKLDIVFVVCNNQSYQILKYNILNYWKEIGQQPGPFPFMDLDCPPIRFDLLAEGMGLRGGRADDETTLRSRLHEAFSTPGAHLIDAVVLKDV